MQSKDAASVSNTFKEFLKVASHHVTKITTDSGTEYNNITFNNICSSNNIHHNTVNPHYQDHKTLAVINNYSKYIRISLYKFIRE